MDAGVLGSSTTFAKDLRRTDVDVNTLVHPRLVEYQGDEWKDV